MNEEKSPLGLPSGSVRSIIAIILVLILAYGFCVRLVAVQIVVDIVLIIIGFYFGSRASEN